MKNSIRQLKEVIHNVPLKKVTLCENESINSIYQKNGSAGVLQVVQNTEGLEEVEPIAQTNIAVPKIISINKTGDQDWNEKADHFLNKNEAAEISLNEKSGKPALEILHENKLLFKTPNNHFYILGSITQDLSTLRVTLMIEELSNKRKERTKIDLYERESVRNLAQQLADEFNQNVEIMEAELLQLTDLLEQFREKQVEQSKNTYKQNRHTSLMNNEQKQLSIEFLKQPDLIEKMDKLIETAGVVGEERTRKLLFIIASTYKMTSPLLFNVKPNCTSIM